MSLRHDASAGCECSPTWPAPRRVLAGVLCAALGVAVAAVQADSLVPPGEPAPDLTLSTLGGETVRLADLKGQVVLLLFGELYNRNSLAAGKDVAAVLARPAMANLKASAYMVVTQRAAAVDLLAEAEAKGITLAILHDEDRRAFAAYRVRVLPSLVVIDGNGVTVLPCAGYPLEFPDLVTDAILFAAGQLSEQEFGRRRAATTRPAGSETHLRAMRLAALGEQLARRGSAELALSRFSEAIALHPDCVPARIGLGTCLLNRRELAEAEKHFLHVLNTAPESVEAALGLIRIQATRGGGELKTAAERLRELLRKRPNDPRVLYLAGLVAEKSGDPSAALGHYKRAAELQLYGPQRKWEVE